MATPFYVTITYALEDKAGNLTGDTDVVTYYASDAAGPLKIGSTTGNTFWFCRGPTRVTDIVSDAAATMLVITLQVNNMLKNYHVRLATCTGASLKRVPIPLRIVQGAMVEWVQSAT
jgi:hypothetical protein